jgi:hypothetical protein
MEEAFRNSVEELKRVDHLIFVSLKYTRTVDVIKNTIHRLISCYDFGMDALLLYAIKKKLIKEAPTIPALKLELLEKLFKENKELLGYLKFYLELRKIIKAEYTKREEYRRHVTMIAHLQDDRIAEVNIDILREYYEKTKSFVTFIKNTIRETND